MQMYQPNSKETAEWLAKFDYQIIIYKDFEKDILVWCKENAKTEFKDWFYYPSKRILFMPKNIGLIFQLIWTHAIQETLTD